MASLDLRLGLAPIVVMTACATSVPAEDASAPAPPIATQQQALAEAPAAPAPVATGPLQVYHLGHSLVGRDMPVMLTQLAAADPRRAYLR